MAPTKKLLRNLTETVSPAKLGRGAIILAVCIAETVPASQAMDTGKTPASRAVR